MMSEIIKRGDESLSARSIVAGLRYVVKKDGGVKSAEIWLTNP